VKSLWRNNLIIPRLSVKYALAVLYILAVTSGAPHESQGNELVPAEFTLAMIGGRLEDPADFFIYCWSQTLSELARMFTGGPEDVDATAQGNGTKRSSGRKVFAQGRQVEYSLTTHGRSLSP